MCNRTLLFSKKRHNLISLAIYFCPFFFSSLTEAQEIKTYSPDKIVVTANRFSEDEKKLPIKVTVISRKEIETSSAENLAQLLNQKMSFYVKESPGMTGTVWIRGMKSDDTGIFVSSKVLVLLNGHPAGTGIVDTIPMISIEKIEVVEGPSSVIYGSGALSGVINIVTAKRSPNRIKAGIETGSFDYSKGEFEAGFNPAENMSFVLSAGSESRTSYEIGQNSSQSPAKYSEKTYQNTAYKNNKAYFGFFWDQDAFSMEGSFQYFSANPVGTPNKIIDNDLNDYLTVNRTAGDFLLSYRLSSSCEMNLNTYFNYHERSNYGVMPPYQYEYHQNILETGLAPSLKFRWDWIEVTAGGNVDYVDLRKIGADNQYQEPETRYVITGFFIENHLVFFRNLNLWFGARIDYYYSRMLPSQGVTLISSETSKNFYYPSFRGGFSYLMGDFVLKSYAGTGFTVPSIMQIAGQYDIMGDQYQGNPNLKPETSFSFQSTAGYDRIHKLLFTYGYQTVNDRITLYYQAPYKTYKNINQARFQFIEAEGLLNWGNLLNVKNLLGTLGIKGTYYFEYLDKETGQDINNAYIPEVKTVGTFTAGYYQLAQFFIDATYWGKLIDGASGENIGHFYLLNTGIEITPFLFINPESKYAPLKFSFQVKNLLGRQYEYVDGYPMPGREYRFGVSYEYKF